MRTKVVTVLLAIASPISVVLRRLYRAKQQLPLGEPARRAAVALVALATTIPCPAQVITSFDAPLAGNGAGQGTIPQTINPAGEIAGSYLDASGDRHGFVRDEEGNITSFDPTGSMITLPESINPVGEIAGHLFGADNLFHGFVRDKVGVITIFDPPGSLATLLCFQDQRINPAGDITGLYVGAGGVLHGFVRDNKGNINSFDAPLAGNGAGQGTTPRSINPHGEITGFYVDASNVRHGFVRER